MAVDTATKRYSMINFGTDGSQMFSVPVNTVSITDRLTLLSLYEGLAADAPASGTSTGAMMMMGIGG